ncbi:MAG: histidine kinase [Bryobacteraceae bacterium]|nr:histidine kinase [Bryobacteraceae bacterium]
MSTAPHLRPGRLKIFLGYAAGVGKTYKMLEEAQQLKRDGFDVVVGYFEPHGRVDTIRKLEGLELIPRKAVDYRGHSFEEMDTDAILRRAPAICAVDEFPHTNVPGSTRAKRWEDVTVLLEAGIDVLTTMNIQHLESLNDRIRDISGVQVRETIPDWVMKQASEVVLIDLTPGALLNRLQRGSVYGAEKAQRAMENFFKEPTLAALRELALRQTAHEVDVRHAEIVQPAAPQGERSFPLSAAPATSEEQERILIHVTESPASAALIRRGRRVADYLKAECFAVCVLPCAGLAELPKTTREAVESHLDFARRLHIETHVLEGKDDAATLVDFARRNGVTQIFLAKPRKRVLPLLQKRQTAMRTVALAKDMQVIIVAERRYPTASQT